MNSIKLIYKFVFRNSIFDNSFGLSRFRLSVMTQPLFENTEALKLKVYKTASWPLGITLGRCLSFLPTTEKDLNGLVCTSLIYKSNWTMPRELLRFVLLDISSAISLSKSSQTLFPDPDGLSLFFGWSATSSEISSLTIDANLEMESYAFLYKFSISNPLF